jgi:hypothetical protein
MLKTSGGVGVAVELLVASAVGVFEGVGVGVMDGVAVADGVALGAGHTIVSPTGITAVVRMLSVIETV